MKNIDAGPIYCSKKINLSGNLNQIFKRINKVVNNQINLIIDNNIIPIPQKGKSKTFKRLIKKHNQIPSNINLNQFYDRIRMLDNIDYPNSYINYGNYKLEFTNAKLEGETLKAQVIIRRLSKTV